MILDPIFQSTNQGGSTVPLDASPDYLPICASKSPRVPFLVYYNDKMVEGFTQLVPGAKGVSQYTQGMWELSPWKFYLIRNRMIGASRYTRST